MEFWPENHGQSSLYSKFGTIPGRNCTHNYHDRHQATHYPLYYGEQQDQSRESSYWTVPGSRTGGAPQEYVNWTDQDLATPTSSHFPFILDRHPQQHHDLGEYQLHEARDREWTAAQRAARDYERGFLREGWQRRWEPCSPVRYNREVSTKRSDSSYRELEAWAARYSHSLPRRRRIEAELRGASQGLLESSRAPERDSRSGTDPRLAALQQVIQSAHMRESGLWDRGGRQQAPTYYPSQIHAPDTTLDVKEKTNYQRRIFSQPPGYIAPPPYNSPHKGSPVLHQGDTSWEQEGKRQAYWSQPTVRKQDVSTEHRKEETEDIKVTDVNQYTIPELKGLKQQRQEVNTSQASSPISSQKPDIQHEDMLSLQQPQALQAVQNKKINDEPSSKVIEGRKFRLNKKTGGMTIFCLVSRIADIQNTETEGVSKDPKSSDVNQTHKLADEVDFRVPQLTEQSSDERNLKAQQNETPINIAREMLNLSNKAETDVSPEKAGTNSADGTSGRQAAQSAQPPSVKYPLWREPSFTSRPETESSPTCLRSNSEDGVSDSLHNPEISADVHPIDIEVRRLDIKKDTESQESKGLLVIDTTCVVVKMELIPSPKKEHVHFLDSTPDNDDSSLDVQLTVSPECVPPSSLLSQHVETDPLPCSDTPVTEPDSDHVETKTPEEESEVTIPCVSSSSVSERETLEERAERILGIPLHDHISEQQPADASSPDSCVKDEEVEQSPIIDNVINDAVEQIQEDTTEEEQSQDLKSEDTVCLQENDNVQDTVAEGGGEDFAGSLGQVSATAEDTDIGLQLEKDVKASSEMGTSEDLDLRSIREEGTAEQGQEENVESDASSQHPCSILPSLNCETSNPASSLMLSSSDLTPNIEEGLDPELIALNPPNPETSPPQTPTQQLPSPPPPGSADDSPSFSLHVDHCPSPSAPDLIDQTTEAQSSIKDEEGQISQLLKEEISDTLEDIGEDTTEDLMSQQQDDAACVEESNITNEQQTNKANEDDTDHIVEPTLKLNAEAEDVVCAKESYLAVEQLPKEIEDQIQTSPEKATEVNLLQQDPQCLQAEDVVCTTESYMTDEQLPKEIKDQTQTLYPEEDDAIEANTLQQQPESTTEEQLPEDISEDSTDISEHKVFEENVTETKTQAEDSSCLRQTSMIEEQSEKEADDDPMGLMEQTTDSQVQIRTEIEQVTEPQTGPSICSVPSPLESDCEASQLPLDVLSSSELPSPPHLSHKSDIESVSLSELDSAPETVPPPLRLDSCEESLTFASPSSSDSASVLSPSSSAPPELEGGGVVASDLPLKEEPQYPKSLWDAVNRIRKHTAPDSENEEEEVNELSDPDSAGEDLGWDMNCERVVFDEAGQQEVSKEGSIEGAEVGRTERDPSGHAEEDTLSCSSASSHGSGDTVIIADEEEVEDMPLDAETQGKIENVEEVQTTEGDGCCSENDETAAEEEEEAGDGDESVTNESSQSQQCLVESENNKEDTGNDGNGTEGK